MSRMVMAIPMTRRTMVPTSRSEAYRAVPKEGLRNARRGQPQERGSTPSDTHR
jgi:hypothetical protein